jgi:hypothetical protein
MTKITLATVKSIKPGEIVWDGTVPGFGLRARAKSKTYFLKARARGRSIWLKIGDVGPGKGFAIILVGLVKDRVIGRLWTSADRFAEHDLDGRSVVQPALPLAEADYEAAALGGAPFDFHRRVCAEQMAAYRGGKFPAGGSCSRASTLAEFCSRRSRKRRWMRPRRAPW